MSMENVRSLLLLNSSSDNHSYSVLFHCARYWAQQGSRVLFISTAPLKHLPPSIGKINMPFHPDAFKLIQFMYLSNWQELLQQLYSIHLRHKPVSVIIVKNLENYFEHDPQLHTHEDHVSLICASLLYAISVCAKVVSRPVFLINDYICKNSSIEKSVIKNYFHNIWELKTHKTEDERSLIKLTRLSLSVSDEIVEFVFYENLEESTLHFDKVVKNIINMC